MVARVVRSKSTSPPKTSDTALTAEAVAFEAAVVGSGAGVADGTDWVGATGPGGAAKSSAEPQALIAATSAKAPTQATNRHSLPMSRP
jgi:hypothetical protein